MPAAGHSPILQPISLHPLLTPTLPSFPPPTTGHEGLHCWPQAASRDVLAEVRRVGTHREPSSLSRVPSSLLLP